MSFTKLSYELTLEVDPDERVFFNLSREFENVLNCDKKECDHSCGFPTGMSRVEDVITLTWHEEEFIPNEETLAKVFDKFKDSIFRIKRDYWVYWED